LFFGERQWKKNWLFFRKKLLFFLCWWCPVYSRGSKGQETSPIPQTPTALKRAPRSSRMLSLDLVPARDPCFIRHARLELGTTSDPARRLQPLSTCPELGAEQACQFCTSE